MPNATTHLIERQTFQLRLDKEEDLGLVSREINRLFEDELSQFMDQALSSLTLPGSYLSIQTLHIDLGTIDIRYFRSAFLSRFREAFLKVITSEIRHHEAMHRADRQLSLLEFFLLKGRNPWWAGRQDTRYDQIIGELLYRRRRPLRTLMRQMAGLSIPRQRLILQATDQTLYNISDILSPGASGFIQSYFQWLMEAYRSLFRQVPASADFRRIAWGYILEYLATHPGGRLDEAYFVKRQLAMLAAHLDTPWQQVSKKVAAVPIKNNDTGLRQIKAIAANSSEKPLPDKQRKDLLNAKPWLTALRMLLEKGYSIPREGYPGALNVRMNYLASHALIHLDKDLYKLLMDIGRQGVVRRRMVHYLYDNVLRDIFRLLVPQQVETLYAYFELSERVRTRTPARNQELQSYRQTVRELALQVIIEKMQDRYDNRIFLREQLKTFALHYRIPYVALLQLLHADLFALRNKSRALSRLYTTIEQLLYGQQATPTTGLSDTAPLPGKITLKGVQQELASRTESLRAAGFAMPDWQFPATTQGATPSIGWLRSLLKQAGNQQAIALLSAAIRHTRTPEQQWLSLSLQQLILPADGTRVQTQAYRELLDFLLAARTRLEAAHIQELLFRTGLPAEATLDMAEKIANITGINHPPFVRWLHTLSEKLPTSATKAAAELLMGRMTGSYTLKRSPRQLMQETIQMLQEKEGLLPVQLQLSGIGQDLLTPAGESDMSIASVLAYLSKRTTAIREAGIPIPPFTLPASLSDTGVISARWLIDIMQKWTPDNPMPIFALLLWTAGDSDVAHRRTADWISRQIQASIFPKGQKNYLAMLAFISRYRRQIPAGLAEQWLRRTAVPDDAGRGTIRAQAKALGHELALVDAWLAQLSASSGAYRYISVRLAQTAGRKEQLPALIAETARWMEEKQGRPAGEILLAWQHTARQSGQENWIKTLAYAQKKQQRQANQAIRYNTAARRLTLADLLRLLDLADAAGTDAEQEQLLMTHLNEHTQALTEQLKRLRHRAELIPLLLENLQAAEQDTLLRHLLGDAYEDWGKDIAGLQQLQEQLALFRMPKESFQQQLMAWSLDFYLSPGAKRQSQSFTFYVLEQLQAQGWLDHRRTIRALFQQDTGAPIPFELAQQLSELTVQPTVVALRPAAIRRQWLDDLALHVLRYGDLPYWAGVTSGDNLWLEPLIGEALQLLDAGTIQPMVSAAIRGGTLSAWHQVLTTEGRIRVLQLLQGAHPAFPLAQWFQEMITSTPEASAALFALLLQERSWTFSSAAQLVRQIRKALPDNLRSKVESYRDEPAPDYLMVWVLSGQSDKALEQLNAADDTSFVDMMQRLWLLLDSHDRWPTWVSSIKSTRLFSLLRRYIHNKTGSFVRSALLLDALEQTSPDTSAIIRLTRIIMGGKQGDQATLEQLSAAVTGQEDRLIAYLRRQPKGDSNRDQVLRTLERQQWKNSRPERRLAYEEAQIRHWLQFGSQPADAGHNTMDSLRAALMQRIDSGSHAFRRQLFAAWKTTASRQRLMTLLREDDYLRLIAWLHPALPDTLQRLERLMNSTGKGNLWPALGLDTRSARMRYLLDQWVKNRISFIDPEALAQTLFQAYASAVKTLPGLLLHQTKPQQQADDTLLRILELRHQATEEAAVRSAPTTASNAEVPLPGEAWHVYNAGLSLIWPFMGRLFRMLDMVEDKDFRDEAQRIRAVQLMQYIVTGQAYNPEADLLLNKILCGMDAGTPVPPELDISEREEQLVESMMKGVLHNWEKMHGTSIPTFRQAFLQREGRLQWRENFWELIVEKKAYDVLLSTLPWQINMIKYSWMSQPLKVVWA
jgi:hypothetical protein